MEAEVIRVPFLFFRSFFPLSITIPHYAASLRFAAPLRDFHFNRGYGGSYYLNINQPEIGIKIF